MNRSERFLVVLLRIGGVLTGSAIVAMFLPAETMASIHAALGLGTFPAAPITDYLTRSLSAFYAGHGALLLLIATDVRRYRPFVLYAGWFGLALGLALTAIDLHSGLPLWWTLAEGPWVAAIGLLILWLARDIEPPGRFHGRESD